MAKEKCLGWCVPLLRAEGGEKESQFNELGVPLNIYD